MTITKLPTMMPEDALRPVVPAEILVSAAPEVASFTAWRDAEAGLSAGRWQATGFESIPRPYGTHELMVLLQGTLSIVMPDGNQTLVSAPGAVVVPKGLLCQWRHEGLIEKYFFILGGTSQPSGATEPVVIDFGQVLADALAIGGGHGLLRYTDPSGRYAVSLWEGRPETGGTPLEQHEFIYVVEGTLALTEAGKPSVQLGTGEAALVPAGTAASWKADAPVRLIRGSFAR